MSLKEKDIDYLSNLSKLDVPSSSKVQMLEKLQQIIELVSKINAADTKNIKPMAHPLDVFQSLREDIVTEKNDIENMQNLVPEHAKSDGVYLVPKVIE